MTGTGLSIGVGASDTTLDGPAPWSDLGAWVGAGRRTPSAGAGFASAFPDHLAMLAARGFTEIRLPLEWARIEPAEGRVDHAAVEHQRLVLGAAADAGLAVWGCLVDGTLPGWFAHDERGFADDRSRRYFWARHVDRVGELFGDAVSGWVPVHEPGRMATRGWLSGTRPPGRVSDAEGFTGSLIGATLAEVEAAIRLRGTHPVSSSTWAVPCFAARLEPDVPPSPDAQVAAGRLDEALWGSFVRMLAEEVLVVPGRAPVETPGAREAFDVIGLGYRHAVAVRGDGAIGPYPQMAPVGLDGHATWAEGLGLVLVRAAESLPGRALRVTGFGRAGRDADEQAAYARAGLDIVTEAREGGIAVAGLWWETPFDPRGGLGERGPGLWDHDRAERPAAAVLAGS